jgi:hypothetical protein
MSRTQLAVLAGIIATVGGGTVIWQSNSDTTLADLQAAGVGTCPTRLVTCNWRIDADGANVLADAGLNVPRGYKTLATRVAVCAQADGGRDVILPPLPARNGLAALASPDFSSCTIAADPGGTLWRTASSRCQRRPLGGTLAGCHRLDGGDQGELNAYPRSELAGAQCEDAACAVFAGESP